MPFINVKLSGKLVPEKIESVKAKLGKAISLLPGKSETYLMVNLETDCHLYFRGNCDAPTAMCCVSVFGKVPRDACEALTAEICNILESEAAVPPNRCYVKFEFSDTWGYDRYLF